MLMKKCVNYYAGIIGLHINYRLPKVHASMLKFALHYT